MYSVGRTACKKTSTLVADSCIGRLFSISSRNASSEANDRLQETDEEGFRILYLAGKKSKTQARKKREPPPILPPRETRMPTNQKWSDVWPGPRTFHPASVPLPIRQGINDLGPSPDKWGNAELMKIPNFLHLTPPAIKMHCEELKKFCTPWPEGLETEEDMKRHFPLETITSDYCFSAPTIRNPLSRIVTIKFPLSRLKFDRHSRDKFLRLVGERYDEETDTVTIVTDKCPVRKQNYDYAIYLLTALYHESWIKEPWEIEKSIPDYEYYDWDNSVSKSNVEDFLNATNQDVSARSEHIEAYKAATVAVFDEDASLQASRPPNYTLHSVQVICIFTRGLTGTFSILALRREDDFPVFGSSSIAKHSIPRTRQFENEAFNPARERRIDTHYLGFDGENDYNWQKYKEASEKLLLS